MPGLSQTTQDRIAQLPRKGKSCRSIGSEFQCSRSVVASILKTLPEERSTRKTGGVPKLTPRDKRRIVHEITHGATKTPKQVATFLTGSVGVRVTPLTVRNVLRESELKARKKAKKPALMARPKQARLHFA
ncbi:hypothetical protein K3495_g7845 [Podosphaera aphanis]|nr:hypothetical protein K3495_g7845 [Podosphaera aphanis]